MPKRIFLLIFALVFLLTGFQETVAQTYSFAFERQEVNVYWNADGTTSIDYVFVFNNEPYASPIDYVDVGLPNSNFEISSIYADVDGFPLDDISASGYQGDGKSGVAIGLGNRAIQPGDRGTVHVFIGTQRRMLRNDSQDREYASAVFSPTWIGAQYVTGSTDISVTYHFPPGVQPAEPRWHESPPGFPAEPETGIDNEGRIIYTWRNPAATGYTQYLFGASFPRSYVPANAVVSPSLWETLGIDPEDAIAMLFCLGFVGFFVFIIVVAFRSSEKRKLQYLPPKIALEGNGIKRGLTAIEAAILLEQPLDKILTMILFALIKKDAVSVVLRDPLKLDIRSPLPEGLFEYETEFAQAFETNDKKQQRIKLQEMTVNLVKSVGNKMRGFSRRETVEYYKSIMEKAWAQVEAAGTPEIKSQKFDEVMEWTMLDRDYDQRTRRTFTGPIIVPTWWGRYDPTYSRPTGSLAPVATTPGAPSGGGVSLPNLPGSDFAASVVNGVQNFSSNVVGNISEFTSGVTNKTNPIPVTTSSSSRSGGRSSGGGCACACACACAGCACACAGGGR
jgi:hypothetical protein